MKVYLAGSSAPYEIERIRHWADRLKSAGIEVVSTWISVVSDVGSANPRDASAPQRMLWSTQDLKEVAGANALWFFAPPEGLSTRGAWVELGCAYTRAMLIVSSGDTKQSIFTALGWEFADDEEAFNALVAVADGRTK